jgi:uncharacterized membrane protein
LDQSPIETRVFERPIPNLCEGTKQKLKYRNKLKGFGGKVLQTSLSKTDEESLQKALAEKV